MLGCGPAGAAATQDPPGVLTDRPAAQGSDLALHQERQSTCAQGDRCKYRITVTNNGPETYNGTINVLRTASFLPESVKHSSEQAVNCSQNLSAVACRAQDVELEAGQSVAFTLSLALPRTAKGQVRHCALVAFPGAEFDDPYRDLVAIIQLALKLRGLYRKGEVDGEMGSDLQTAIQALRNEENLGEGEIDAALIKAMFGPAGLMKSDPNSENDQVCDSFDLPKIAQAGASEKVERPQPRVRRAAQPRKPDPNTSYALRKRKRGWHNIRLDGFD